MRDLITIAWDWRRCLAKDPAHFAKRNRYKIDLGLDA